MTTKKKVISKKKNTQPKVINVGDELFMISSLGVKVKLQAVSPYLIENVKVSAKNDWIDGYIDEYDHEIEGRGSEPVIPTYEAKVGDSTMELAHDLTTLDDDMYDADEKAANHKAWADYQIDLHNFDTFITTRLSRLILHKGIEVSYPPEDDISWEREQVDIYHATVPDTEPQRKIHYVETEILGSKEDVATIVAEVMGMIGVDRTEVDRIKEDIFQS